MGQNCKRELSLLTTEGAQEPIISKCKAQKNGPNNDSSPSTRGPSKHEQKNSPEKIFTFFFVRDLDG